MKKNVLRVIALPIGLLILCSFPPVSKCNDQDTYKVDLVRSLSTAKIETLQVFGIGLNDSVEDILTRIGKGEEAIEKLEDMLSKDEIYKIEIRPGVRVFTGDRVKITSILITSDAKDSLEGDTIAFLRTSTSDECLSFLKEKIGEPKYIKDMPLDLGTEFYFPSGIIFSWIQPSTQNMLPAAIEICSSKELEAKAKKDEAILYTAYLNPELENIPLSKTGFRETLWGMGKEQVKAAETARFLYEKKGAGEKKGIDELAYDYELDGLKSVILYHFAAGRLTKAYYLITAEHTNKNIYISDYKRIKAQLKSKYGEPIHDEEKWLNGLYKDNPEEYGMAISVGHLIYVTDWHSDERSIRLSLSGDNFRVALRVEYSGGMEYYLFEERVIKRIEKGIW